MTATVVSTVLNRENYKDWSFRMKTYFLAEDLWDVVEGTNKEPVEGEKRKDAKALYAIQNSCGDDAYPLIKDKTKAKEAWRTLSNIFKRDEKPSNNAKKPVDEAYPNTLESALEEGLGVTEGAGHDEIQKTFVKFVVSNDWDNAFNFLRRHPQAGNAWIPIQPRGGTALHYATASVTDWPDGGTALHHAIRKRCSVHILQELVKLMNNGHLAITVGGYTALYVLIGLSPDRVEVAECMVKKNPKLPTILPDEKPLVVVAQGNAKGERMARYLYSLTAFEKIRVIDAAQLISDGFRFERFDIAWDLIQRYPELAMDTDHDMNIPLGTLASNRFAFKSGSPLNLWEKLIYYGIRISPLPLINKDDRHIIIDVREPESEQTDQGPLAEQKENKRHHLISSGTELFKRLVVNFQTFLGIHHIYQKKLVHERIQQFLPLMCNAVRLECMSFYQEKKLQEALYMAAERGHVEYIDHFLRSSSCPVLGVRNEKNQSLLQIAAECRQYNVYNKICEFLRKIDKDGLDKSEHGIHFNELDKAMEYKDDLGNNILHTVARITPLSRIDKVQGAVLQMQSELQWFKMLESIMDVKDCESVNKDNKIPREVFTENHKEMWKRAKDSMKETANSCTIIGTLIMTIMFAAVFTVPGGYDGGTGLPIFLTKKVFIAFMVSNALSLFSSTTSVIMFLSIITSRYNEDNVHGFLPTKMIIGLFTLSLSIATMMIVFSCALYLMLDGNSWIVIPTILLASVPLTSYLRMQFPLLVESFLLLELGTFEFRSFLFFKNL